VKRYRRTRFHHALSVLATASLLVAVSNCAAQDSNSRAAAVNTVPDAPTAALRDALVAACSQSQEQFSKFLTARNAQTFARLTPSARVALMKRFVLLNEPGKASLVPSPSGRPTVRCETPAGAAELQIGGAEIADNFALLPVEEREATDTVGNDPIRIKMGLIRENSAWKLMSVGLVLLDLPTLAFEWDAEEIESTERGAIEALKKIADAVEAYRRAYTRLPDSLASLGPPPRGSSPSADTAGLLEPDLASGVKGGYKFRVVIAGASTVGAPAKYELAATPEIYGRTGRRSFFRDAGGTIRGADHQGSVGSELDPKVN
jgi:type IV pilus assembly protein PilA